MAGSRISRLDFQYGLEEVSPLRPADHAGLPTGGALQPSNEGPASRVEELVAAPSFAGAIDEFVRPQIADLGICRPERFAALLAEAREILQHQGDAAAGGAASPELVDVLERQDGLRDLLGYYVQSLLSA
jgi:hypothetical protein